MKETFKEKIDHIHKVTGKSFSECVMFVNFIHDYLDSCGYFHADLNIHGFERPKDYVRNMDKDLGTWLIDMALQYNMEQGIQYKCNLVKDKVD